MFNDGDEAFHELIRTQLIVRYVKGDFYAGRLAEVAGGKKIALKNITTTYDLLSLARFGAGHLLNFPSPR